MNHFDNIITEEIDKVIYEGRNKKGQYTGQNNKSLQDAVKDLLNFVKKDSKSKNKADGSNKEENKKDYQTKKKQIKSSHKRKEGNSEYTSKHGDKEANGMRQKVINIAKSDGVNNAAICRRVEQDNPDIHIDSSYVTKMTQNKPGYTSGVYHWDKEKADAFLQAADELGVD